MQRDEEDRERDSPSMGMYHASYKAVASCVIESKIGKEKGRKLKISFHPVMVETVVVDFHIVSALTEIKQRHVACHTETKYLPNTIHIQNVSHQSQSHRKIFPNIFGK